MQLWIGPLAITRALNGMEMENGMEWKFRYGIWKIPEWNGRQSFILYTNSILDFVHCIYEKKHMQMSGSDK